MSTSKEGDADALPEKHNIQIKLAKIYFMWKKADNQVFYSYFIRMKSVHKLVTWIHFADLLNEGLIEASNDSTTYWNHKIFVQALNKSIYSAYSSTLYQKQTNKQKSTAYIRKKETHGSIIITQQCNWNKFLKLFQILYMPKN